MSDPWSVIPYHDPHNTPINLEYLECTFDSNPSLANLDEQQPQPTSVHLHSDEIVDPNHPFDDPVLWNYISTNNNNGGSNSFDRQSQEAGPSKQNYSNEGDAEDVRSRSFEDGIGTPLTIFPPPWAPFQCTCCQVLREIIHTGVLVASIGNCTSKLEIHGRLGIICHAVLENKGPVIGPRYHMIDFCKKNIVNVKQFLRQYCEDQKKAGFVLVQDPLSIFYQALCVGIEWEDNMNNDDFSDPSPSTWVRPWDQTEGGNEGERMTRTTLAQQRQRTGKLTLKDFRAYFDLPIAIEEAAKRMNLCPTVVKKICRRFGMNRWPHRKIKSIQRQMANLRPLATSNNLEEKARALSEIQRLQQEISNICSVTIN